MQHSLLNLDHQNSRLKKLSRRVSVETRQRLDEHLRVSWVFHDHALEGVVLTERELSFGIAGERGKDTCEQATLDGVVRLYEAIASVRAEAATRAPIALGTLKQVHTLCAPVQDPNAGRYRKVEGPLGAYLHESPPAKAISQQLRRLAQFIELEAMALHPVQAAAEVHHQFMQIFPFDRLTGRAGRLLLNLYLMREGFVPVIIPASLRADYYASLCEPTRDRLLALLCDVMHASLEFAAEQLSDARAVSASAA